MTSSVVAGAMGGRLSLRRGETDARLWQESSADEPGRPAERRVAIAGWVRGGQEDVLARLEGIFDAGRHEELADVQGNFVLAHLSRDRTTVTLYRPPHGLWPVFVRRGALEVEWSTDLARLVPGNVELGDLDTTALGCVLLLDRFPPGRSHVKDIEQVPSGTVVSFTSDGRSSVEVDDFREHDNTRLGLREASDQLRARVSDAVAGLVELDGDLEVLFSGGLDSSAVAYEALAHGGRPTAYCWDLAKRPSGREAFEQAAVVATALGIEFVPLDYSRALSPARLVGAAAPSLPACDSMLSVSTLPGPSTSRRRVVLSGQYADHLFESAPDDDFAVFGWRMLDPRRAGIWPWHIRRDLLRGLVRPAQPFEPSLMHQGRFASWHGSDLRDVVQAMPKGTYGGQSPLVRRSIEHGVNSVFQQTQVQQAARSGAVYAFPFLDRRVIEFCLSLDRDHRSHQYQGRLVTKLALRWAYRGRLPDATVRDKLNAPDIEVDQHFMTRHRGVLAELLGEDSVVASLGIIDPGKARAMLRAGDLTMLRETIPFLRVACLEAWLREHVAGAPALELPSERRPAPVPSRGKESGGPSSASGVLALAESVSLTSTGVVHLLTNASTRDFVNLNEDAYQIVQTLTACESWEQARAALASSDPDLDPEAIIPGCWELVTSLAADGWVRVIKPAPNEVSSRNAEAVT